MSRQYKTFNNHLLNHSALKIFLTGTRFIVDNINSFARTVLGQSCWTDAVIEKMVYLGYTINHAVLFNDMELVGRLLEYGVNINDVTGGYFRQTALIQAVSTNNLDMVNCLIRHGADVNALDYYGVTALLISAQQGNSVMVKILLENGANPSCKDQYDREPLFAVFDNSGQENGEFSKCAELLLKYGAVPRNSVFIRQTLFDFGLSYSMDRTIKTLVSHLAMLEKFGTPIINSVMYCAEVRHRPKMADYQDYYKQCLQVLMMEVFGKSTLLDLLQENQDNLRTLIRKETFIFEVEKICSESKLSELYSYYYNRLMKNVAEANQ